MGPGWWRRVEQLLTAGCGVRSRRPLRKLPRQPVAEPHTSRDGRTGIDLLYRGELVVGERVLNGARGEQPVSIAGAIVGWKELLQVRPAAVDELRKRGKSRPLRLRFGRGRRNQSAFRIRGVKPTPLLAKRCEESLGDAVFILAVVEQPGQELGFRLTRERGVGAAERAGVTGEDGAGFRSVPVSEEGLVGEGIFHVWVVPSAAEIGDRRTAVQVTEGIWPVARGGETGRFQRIGVSGRKLVQRA